MMYHLHDPKRGVLGYVAFMLVKMKDGRLESALHYGAKCIAHPFYSHDAAEETLNKRRSEMTSGTIAVKAFDFGEEDCPGHVASDGDPKVCGRCGIHIDSFRPDDGCD